VDPDNTETPVIKGSDLDPVTIGELPGLRLMQVMMKITNMASTTNGIENMVRHMAQLITTIFFLILTPVTILIVASYFILATQILAIGAIVFKRNGIWLLNITRVRKAGEFQHRMNSKH